jgi:hypothetical protein
VASFAWLAMRFLPRCYTVQLPRAKSKWHEADGNSGRRFDPSCLRYLLRSILQEERGGVINRLDKNKKARLLIK